MLGDLVTRRHLFCSDQTKKISSLYCLSVVIVRLGLYLFDLPSRLESVGHWEKQLGHPVQLLSIYQAWGSKYRNFYAKELREIHKTARTALITWEPWALPLPGQSQGQPLFALRSILAGDYDDYISSWARASKSLGVPYLLRPMHEMNGNWYPWCGTVNGNQPEEYVEAWKYLHGIFRAVGATQVAWVWCPYASSYPDSPKNTISCYYPGDAYVDWIALDGYNWGKTQPWSRWENFSEIFATGYNIVTRLTDKPVLIAETASTEIGGSKSEWIRSTLERLKESFPRIEGIVWFNVQKECDWRIDSSEGALRAFRETVQNWLTSQ
jgi:beta-mannanase